MKRKGWGLFRMVLSFFAGVLVTLYLLVPGKNGPTLLVNGDPQSQNSDLDRAGQKIQRVGDWALKYAYRAKDWIRDKDTPQP